MTLFVDRVVIHARAGSGGRCDKKVNTVHFLAAESYITDV